MRDPMLRYSLKALLALGLAFALATGVTLYLAIESEPTVRRSAEVTPANAKRAKQILEQAAPVRSRENPPASLTISEQDLDLAANYLAHFYANGGARVTLQQGQAEFTASLRPPWSPLIFYFNVSGVLAESMPVPRFKQMNVGRVLIPGAMADWLFLRSMRRFLGRESLDAASQNIKQIELRSGRLSVVYDRPAQLREKLQRAAFSAADQERLRIYQERLSLIGGGAKSGKVSLTEPLVALFELALTRSKQGDPAAESRAAIIALAYYASHKSLTAYLPAARDWARAGDLLITLHGRNDLAKHFLVSAALAAKAGGPLADALGLGKEVEDSRSGSGFSFADVAANRAGARFGNNAVDGARALKLQQQIAAGIGETDLMPAVQDLPEALTEAEFKQRMGGVGAPEYNRMIGEIDGRITALKLYR
jgi:hypothetical protein